MFVKTVAKFLNQILCRQREAEKHVRKALHALGHEDLRQLLDYVKEWNTKPKLCHVAQFVLFTIFNILSPTEIIEVCCLLFFFKVN